MRALRYEGPDNGVRLSQSAPEPTCAPGWAIVRPTRVGIGALERAITAHPNGIEPITLGHEFVGVVRHIEPNGSQSDRYSEYAARRVVGSMNIVCQRCDMCRSGLSSHCRERKVLGLLGADGCFADAVAVPLTNLHLVPDTVDDDAAVFAEPLAAAVQAAQQIRIEDKPFVTVLGDGVVGHLCAQVLTRLNASVRIIGQHQHKLDLAEKWGVQHRLASDIGRRADQDVVVDCTGSSAGLALSMQLVRPRGKIVLKSSALPNEGEPCIDVRPIVEREIELIGSRCGPIPEALSLLENNQVDVVSLISRRSKLDDGEAALRAALEPEQIKVLMDV